VLNGNRESLVMSKAATTVNPHLKQKIRAEIESQVRDFLAQCGKIHAIDTKRGPQGKPCASAWQGTAVLDELFD